MTCPVCGAPLRASNTIGYCRKHRRQSPVYKSKKTGYDEQSHRRNPDRLRDASLRNRYGISLHDKREMHAQQDGRCAICLKEVSVEKIHTDHDHTTGRVRGLLCASCNVAIGLLGDNTDRLLQVIRYLS